MAGEPCDLLVALHAHKSHASLARHAHERPDAPRILALTGTDLYEELLAGAGAAAREARESLALATRIVVLQPLALRGLPEEVRGRGRLVLTSRSEGGANVVTEAIAAGVPVLSTRIDGSLGILGDAYPGYFDVGDAAGLAALLERCEVDAGFLGELARRVAALRPLIDPATERASWRALLSELLG